MRACSPHNQYQSVDDCASLWRGGSSLGNTISRRVTEDSVNARANFPKERNLRDISRHSRVLFERIPGTQGIWRVAPSYRLNATEPPH